MASKHGETVVPTYLWRLAAEWLHALVKACTNEKWRVITACNPTEGGAGLGSYMGVYNIGFSFTKYNVSCPHNVPFQEHEKHCPMRNIFDVRPLWNYSQKMNSDDITDSWWSRSYLNP